MRCTAPLSMARHALPSPALRECLQLESGDIKLRVRALEVERASRRAAVMQSATLSTVGALGLLNLGSVMAMGHVEGPGAALCMALSCGCGLLALTSIKRVQRLDKFEKEIRGG